MPKETKVNPFHLADLRGLIHALRQKLDVAKNAIWCLQWQLRNETTARLTAERENRDLRRRIEKARQCWYSQERDRLRWKLRAEKAESKITAPTITTGQPN
jgi:hypothetical protein